MRRAVFNMRDERAIWTPPSAAADRIRSALPEGWELIDVQAAVSGRGDGGGVSAEALAAVRGAEIYLGLGLPRELLLAALEPPARLRWIHTGAAGVASLLHPELTPAGITLTNSAGIHAPPIAETVLGMMLHFARGLDIAVRGQQRGAWTAATFERHDGTVRELAGAELGIVGYGGIGRAVAKLGHAVGMRVRALRRRAGRADTAAPADVEVLAGADALVRLLGQSDYIVLCLPSTTTTRALIGDAELHQMRRGAVLVNVARGDIVVEQALVAALQEGQLRGAALDVFTTEPLAGDSPLWRLDNVLITPHVSGTTPHYWERELELIVDNTGRYVRGEPLRNVVDLTAGY